MIKRIQERDTPIQDLTYLYRRKIPKELKFVYDETLKNLETMINENAFDGTKEELMELVFWAHANKDVQNQVSRMLVKEFKSCTTKQFSEIMFGERNLRVEMTDYTNRKILDNYQIWDNTENEELRQAWLQTRTMAYLQGIGRSDDVLQYQLLMHLQESQLKLRKTINYPQYFRYNDLNDKENYIILSNIQDQFKVIDQEGVIDARDDLKEQQNRGKKGLRALFKKKSDKEPITDTIILNQEGNNIQVLNRYETGRLEIAILDSERKNRVVNKISVEPQDIGYNGGLEVVKDEVVSKVSVKHQGVPTITQSKSAGKDVQEK